MKKILLVMSTSGYSPEAANYAVRECKKNDSELLACYIIDAEVPDAVSSWMIYVGFMGDEPSEDYKNVVLAEYKDRAQETLDEVTQLAQDENVAIKTYILEGSLVENAVKIAKENNADLIVINKPQQVDFSRLLHGSTIEALKKKAPCPVKVID